MSALPTVLEGGELSLVSGLTLSDLIVQYLEMMGVEFVFGVPGVHVMGIFEALARSASRGGPRAVLTRHESGAAFMASGYARETGRLGVCCVTAGPGTTNAITGIMSAHSEHLPVLLISGQGVVPAWGQGYVQESSPYEASYPDIVDTAGMLAHCTRYNAVVSHRLQLESKIAAAIMAALESPLRGAAHLSVPPDILNAPWHGRAPDAPALRQQQAYGTSFMEERAVEALWQRMDAVLQRQGRILLHVGWECRDAGATIEALAERLGAEIISSVQGRAWVSPGHALFRGIFGPQWGHPSAEEALTRAPIDLLLSLGSSLSAADTGAWCDPMFQNLVHVHPSDAYFKRSPMAQLHVRGTVKRVLEELLQRLENRPDLCPAPGARQAPAGLTRLREDLLSSHQTPIKPQRLVHVLSQRLPADTRVVTDIGNSLVWTAHYLLRSSPHHYHVMFAQSCMGSGPGTAIGIAMATRGTPVVCVIGDGAMLMAGNELTVAVEESLSLLFVILNDAQLGMVRCRHSQAGLQPVDLHVPAVDFALLAQAMGAQGFTIKDPDMLDAVDFGALCRRPGPTVLNVLIDPNEGLSDLIQ